MDTSDRPRRRFVGPRPGAGVSAGMAAVADALLSSPEVPRGGSPSPPREEPGTGAPSEPREVSHAIPSVAVPEGLYVLVPAGVDPADRRDAVLAAAHRLAPLQRPVAVLLLDNGRIEAHVLGEVAAGRLGPENHLGALDLPHTFVELAGQCAQVAVVPLGQPNGALEALGPAAERPIFLVRPDEESVVEAYRTLKAWRPGCGRTRPAVLFAGTDGPPATLLGRLRRAAQTFLGCDVAVQDVARPGGAEHEPPIPRVRVFTDVPAEAVWPALLAAMGAAGPGAATGPALGVAQAVRAVTEPGESFEPVGSTGPRDFPVAAPAAAAPAFALWEPEDREALLSAIADQLPGLVDGRLRQVFRVDVDEPGAPPLAAVRGDGTLVAVLVVEPGQAADTQAAERWMAVHRRLLARAYPAVEGVEVGSGVASIVLAPMGRAERPDGVRRIVPVRLGGHKGIVLLP